MPEKQDPITKEIPCECGKPDCKAGLIVGRYPGGKIKIQVFEGDEIKSVAVDKNKLLEQLKGLK